MKKTLDKPGTTCYNKTIEKRKENLSNQKGKEMIIYRVVGETGPFISKWVTSLKEAKEIKRGVEKSIIFGGTKYFIEKAELNI